MKLSSSAFKDGRMSVPADMCDGSDLSPPLSRVNLPKQKNLVLIADGSDVPAGPWELRMLFNHGRSGCKALGYIRATYPISMCRWFFTPCVFKAGLELKAETRKETLLAATDGHLLAETQFIGTYKRTSNTEVLS